MASKLRAGVVWANTFNRFDPASPFGGYKESGFGREGGRHGLEAYLDCLIRDRTERLAVRKTYKLYIGGAFPRSESGPLVSGAGRRRGAARARRAGLAQGRPRRRRRRPQGVRRAGPAPPPTTAARCSTGSPRCSRAGGTSSSPRWRRPSRSRPAADRAVDAADRPLGLVRGLGRQVRAGRRRRPTRSPGRTSTSACPSRPASSASSRRRTPACSAWSASLAPVIATGNTAVVVAVRDRPLPAVIAGRGARHLRPARRRRQPAHRLHRRAGARGWPATATSTRST